jgi:hypothetical protein
MTDAQKLAALRVVVASSVGVIRKLLTFGGPLSFELRQVEEALEKALAQSYPEEKKDEHN